MPWLKRKNQYKRERKGGGQNNAQEKSKKGTQQPPLTDPKVDPLDPPADWDGIADWAGSALKIVDEP